MTTMKTQNPLGYEKESKLLVNFAIPCIISMLVTSLYNIVDQIFIGQGIGMLGNAATNIAFPLSTTCTALSLLLGIGSATNFSLHLGAGEKEKSARYAGNGIFLMAVFGLCLFLATTLFLTPMLKFFGATTEVLPYARQYTRSTAFGFPFLIANTGMSKLILADGSPRYSMISMLIGAIVNTILDPIFIFGFGFIPAMGVKGAAIATVMGQIIAMFYALYIALKKDFHVKFTLKNFKFRLKTVKDIYVVGIPSIVMQSIASVLITFLNKILIVLTPTAVTVLGVYYKLQSFVFMPVFGLTQGVMPIMGYNYGARNRKRLVDAVKKGTIIAAVIMAIGTAIFSLFPRQLLMIFNAKPDMLEIGMPALRIISLNFIPAAIGIMFGTFFQAIGKGVYSLTVSFLRQIVLILPVAKFLSQFGVINVWFAFPIAESFSLVFCIFMYINVYKKQIKTMQTSV